MNALFTKYGNRVQFVSNIYKFDKKDNIPDNTHIHVWGANATNWNKGVCKTPKKDINDGNCGLSKFSSHDGHVAENIKYQVLGVFGIVTTVTLDDKLNKLNEKCLTRDYTPSPLYSDAYYETCKCDWKDSFPDSIEIDVKNTDLKDQYNGIYKIIERKCNVIFYQDMSIPSKRINIIKNRLKYNIELYTENKRNNIIIENIDFNSIFDKPFSFKYHVFLHDKKPTTINLIIKNLSSQVKDKSSSPKTPGNTILGALGAVASLVFRGGGNNNNSTNSKKKYTYKYMVNKRHRKRRSRKQRGGQFGASQWAPSLIGSTITEQENHLQGGVLSANDSIMSETLKYQGGSRGGNIANVLAQGAAPASLFAANYMYSPRKRSHRKKHNRKHKKTHRKFRLY